VSGPVERTHWELDHGLPPGQVVAALVDFSDRRPRIWTETCDPAVYRVHAVGDGWAEATEGVPGAWSRERYDWTVPGTVTLIQLDGNLIEKMGRIEYTIVDGPVEGSHIVCERKRYFRGDLNGRLRGTIMKLAGGPILRRQFRLGLDRWAVLDPGE
jgi:hypothetical protein